MRVVLMMVLAAFITVPADAAPKYRINEIVRTDAKLNVESSVLISVPRDGAFGGRTYAGSGQQAAEATRNVFARRLQRVALDPVSGIDAVAGIAKAVSGGYSHYCQLEILHWEDRATEWSGKRDKIEIKFTLFDSVSGQIVRSATISSVSKLFSFGGDRPQELADAHMHVLIDPMFE